jgi:vitamin K-dependent gamma-carboxylase
VTSTGHHEAPPKGFIRLKRSIEGACLRSIDPASLAVFRMLLGLTMCVSLVRFMASGWIEIVYERPSFFFKYPGFFWVEVFSPPLLYGLFGSLAGLALMIALGAFYRVATVLFFLGFSYVQLMDVTNYLNHYYLVVLFSLLLVFLPLHRVWSVDAWRRSMTVKPSVPGWVLVLLRFQVGVVYANAALAKFTSDWLLHAQPMNLWMSARTELPMIGHWLQFRESAYILSWAGFLYDLSIVPLLLWRRSRPYAYATVLVFHATTQVFFDIGMFPTIMVVSTTLFFEPDWPRKIVRRFSFGSQGLERGAPEVALAPWKKAVLLTYVVVQLAIPLRSHFYPGSVLWNEEGMRFSWRVMVREKNGSITYWVRDPQSGRTWAVSPFRYLEWRQANEMSGQPDLIHQLARYIAGEFRNAGVENPEVRVEAWVSLNGRKPSLLVDPNVNLAAVEPGLRPSHWIFPEPREPPIALGRHLVSLLSGNR